MATVIHSNVDAAMIYLVISCLNENGALRSGLIVRQAQRTDCVFEMFVHNPFARFRATVTPSDGQFINRYAGLVTKCEHHDKKQ